MDEFLARRPTAGELAQIRETSAYYSRLVQPGDREHGIELWLRLLLAEIDAINKG